MTFELEKELKELKDKIKKKDSEIIKLKEHNQILLKTALKQKMENMQNIERLNKLTQEEE